MDVTLNDKHKIVRRFAVPTRFSVSAPALEATHRQVVVEGSAAGGCQ